MGRFLPHFLLNKNTMRILFLIFPVLVWSQNSIQIKGFTNINSFKCTNEKVYIQKESKPSDLQVKEINVRVDEFKCDTKKMTQEFQKMMNVKKYPMIRILFERLSPRQNDKLNAEIAVAINGKRNLYPIPISYKDNNLYINKWLIIQDFNLEPPTALGGLIKVKDEVLVEVRLSNY